MRNTNARLQRRAFSLALAIHCTLVTAASYADVADDAPADQVIVLGRGEPRQVQSVSAVELSQLPAGTSPLKGIEKLPGVNFQSTDPYGAYEWSARITVRGFNQNRLGFTLDGVPLGDMTYGNHNGLHISRAIPSELVNQVVLSQGTGSLDTASASNLGGTVAFSSDDPAAKFGGDVQQMFGSDSAHRTFARLDTGEIGAAGTRMLIAAADSSTDKWKGGGDQQQRMYNLKVVQPIGAGKLTGYYNYSDRAEIDYQDLSKAIVARRGWQWDNYFPHWSDAVAAAQACNASGQNDTVVCDDGYWNASGLRVDRLGYIAFDLPITDAVTWKANVYSHSDDGQGLWGTPYVASPGGVPISVRTTEYDLNRVGLVTSLSARVGEHEIKGGGWYEDNDFTQSRRFYAETSLAASTRSFTEFLTHSFRTDWSYKFKTKTTMLYIEDVWSVTDQVRINAGVRSLDSQNHADTIVGPVKNGTLETKENFLPQLGVNWRVTDSTELFASAARNVRAFSSSGTSGPFSTSDVGFDAIRDVIKPEKSTNYEAGMRWRPRSSTDFLLAAYHVDFSDRLIGIPQCVGIVGCPTVLANVGDVSTNGVEAALAVRPIDRVTWFTSVSWNDSKYDNDYTYTDAGGAHVVRVKDKEVPDAPKILIKSEISYDTGAFFARADINYTDKRFYTYLNDGSVPSYMLLNAGAGYRMKELGPVRELVLEISGTNLTDKKYFSTIDSNGFTNSDPNGTWQSLLAGAPRQVFFSARAKF